MTKVKSRFVIKNIYGFNAVKAISVLLSFVCFFVLICEKLNSSTIGIVFLPLSFLLVSLIFDFRKNIKGLGSFIIYCSYMLRFTLFPVLIVAGGYRSDVHASVFMPYFNRACVIMIIEFVCVFALLAYLGSKSLKRKNVQVKNENCVQETNIEHVFSCKAMRVLIILCLLYNLGVYAIYPSLIKLYWRIAFVTEIDIARLESLVSTIPGMIYYPFKLTSELLKFLLTALIIVKINVNTKRVCRNWILTLIVVAVSFAVMSSEQINSVIMALSILYYMLLKYIKYDRFIVTLGFIGLISLVILCLINIADVTGISSLGRIANIYFNGPINVALACSMRNIISVGLDHTIEDILSAIPVISRITNSVSISEIFNTTFNIPGAILPMSGYGYFYFGYLGCWIPAVIVVLFVNALENIAENNLCPEYKLLFMFCLIRAGIVVFMYTFTIFCGQLIYHYILPYVIYALDKRFTLNGEKSN